MRRAAAWLILAALASTCRAEPFFDRVKDPDDGALDLSEYLLDHRGALVVPIVITEPAVGYGGGAALLWFSESMREAAQRAEGGRVAPPDIYLAAGFGTDNGTRGAIAGARLSFAEDRWRYRGIVGVPKVNLDVTPRWIGVAFLGAGRAWGRDASFGDTPTRVAKGVGFRYMIARRLGLSMGLDVARGPEGDYWYISVGNTWR
jgi:hypothetical protein